MVCLGACLIIIVSAYGFADVLNNKNVTLDPSRIAAQVISGIGFIGAGTIIFLRQGTIRGLTTASGLWTVAAIGLATGGGMYMAALLTTILAVIILWLLQPLERLLSEKYKQYVLKITTPDKSKSLKVLNDIITVNGLEVLEISLTKAEEDFIISCTFKQINKQQLASLANELQSDEQIKEVFWKV